MLTFIVLLLILFMAVIVLVVNRLITGHWDYRPNEYDERQKVARGLASRDTLGITLVLLCIWYMVQAFELSLPVSGEDVTILIAFVVATVYAVDCIFRDAYLGLHVHPTRWIVLSIVAFVIDLINAWRTYTEGENGWMNFLFAILLGVILVAFGIKSLMKRINASNDEDE